MNYSKFFEIISTYVPLEQRDMELIKLLFKYESVTKRTFLIKAGEQTDKIFFILSGYLRYFKVLDTAEELVIHLIAPNHFTTSLNSFFLGTQSEGALQAITDCEVFYISKSDLEKSYATAGDKWQTFGRQMMENHLLEKEQRLIDQLSLSAYDRYLTITAAARLIPIH